MKKASFWQPLKSTHGVLILLFVAAAVVLCWLEARNRNDLHVMESTHQNALQRRDQLDTAKDRVVQDVMEISGALQSLLLEPKNVVEKNRASAADKDLAGAIESLQAAFPAQTELVEVTKKLRDLHSPILQQADSDLPGAVANLGRSLPAIRENRSRLLASLNHLARAAAVAETPKSRTSDLIQVWLGVLILLVCALVVWFQSGAVARPLALLIETLERMRKGDFTQRLALDGQEQFVEVGEGLNRLADDLSTLVGQVQRSGVQVSANATRIAATAKEQQNTAHEIAATTAGIGATSREISATSEELARTIDEVNHVARDTAKLANSGQTAIARMESTMRQIMDSSSSITAKLAVLNEKTTNINSVVTAITKVADQTNLLSLNAAIEAEKAGEYGLGFAGWPTKPPSPLTTSKKRSRKCSRPSPPASSAWTGFRRTSAMASRRSGRSAPSSRRSFARCRP
jgi:methyl-accepting chemotaxis protein WspA